MKTQILRMKIHVRQGPPSPTCQAAGQRLWAQLLGISIPSKSLGDEMCMDRSYRPQPEARSGRVSKSRRARGESTNKERMNDTAHVRPASSN
jgi:hypothetical protein